MRNDPVMNDAIDSLVLAPWREVSLSLDAPPLGAPASVAPELTTLTPAMPSPAALPAAALTTATKLDAVVARKWQEADGVFAFELAPVAGGTLPAFTPGAHIDVHLASGLVRQYSLVAPYNANGGYEIGVLRDPKSRGGSIALHDDLKLGDLIHISVPRNQFPLAAGARRSLLIAGGIGVTPLLCMAEALSRQGAAFEMHYCARSRGAMGFVERIERSTFAGQVSLHLDDGPAAQRFDMAAVLQRPDAGTHLYVCGPQGFLDAVLATAKTGSWPEAQVHFERFGAAPAVEGDTAFEVVVASTGQVVRVGPGQTAIQALADVGVAVPTSCEQGICGACVTRVLDGEPEHRDMYLTPTEQAANDCFTPCCSRARSTRLVLDL